jgi:N-acetylglucosaminyldiphosphoundecaprenol N-acetyl-beta-D-mannosaminyltransferase
VLVEIALCRRLIFGGGTLLQSETSRRSLIYYASLLLVARLLGKECILWGNGIGAVRGRFEKRLIGAALGCCSYIGLRDMRSLAIARHMLSKQGREGAAVLEGDLAERAESLYSDSERAEGLLSGLFGEDRREIVAAIPRGKRSEDELLRFSKILAREKARGREILMIVMNTAEDGKVCEALARSLGGRLIFGICFGDTVELLRKCKRVYSMRLHGLVAAHIAGIELCGMGEDEKIKRYCAERGGSYICEQENQ